MRKSSDLIVISNIWLENHCNSALHKNKVQLCTDECSFWRRYPIEHVSYTKWCPIHPQIFSTMLSMSHFIVHKHFGQASGSRDDNVGCIAMKFYTNIHGPERMNHTGDPLTFACLLLLCHYVVYICGFSKMSWQLLDELPWNLLQACMFSSGGIVIWILLL